MKWEKFDKKVNSELDGHQADVDIDALWGAIEPAVDAINTDKKKRRGGIFWWFFGGLLLVGMGLGVFLFNKNDAQIATDLNVEKTVIKGRDIVDLNKKETDDAVINIEKATDEIEVNFKEVTKESEQLTTLNKAKSQSDFSENQDNIRLEKERILKNTSGNGLIEKGKFTNEMDLNNSKNGSVASDNQEAKVRPIANADVVLKKSNSIDEKEAKNVIENQRTNPFILNTKDKNRLSQLPVDLLKEMEVSLADLQRKTLNDADAEAIKEEIKAVAAAQKKRAKKKANASMSLYGGVGLTARNLSSKNDSLDNSVLSLREDTERSLETIQLGMQFHLQHEKTGLELTTGLNYTQINERFDYNTAVIEMDSIEGVEFVYRNVNGDTVETVGMLPRTTTTTFTNRHYNKYQLIDIPVLLGYRKVFGKFSFGAQAGVLVNLRLKTSGRMLASESEIVNIEDTETFKSSVGLSYYFGATIDYELTKKWSISAAPFVRHLPNNFANANYELKQKYTQYGLNVGVRYRIN